MIRVGARVRDVHDGVIGVVRQQVHTHNNPGDVIAYTITDIDDPDIEWFAFEDEIEEAPE